MEYMCRRAVSFTLWQIYPLYPLSAMLARTQPVSAQWKISHLAPVGIEALLWRQVRKPVTVFTEQFVSCEARSGKFPFLSDSLTRILCATGKGKCF